MDRKVIFNVGNATIIWPSENSENQPHIIHLNFGKALTKEADTSTVLFRNDLENQNQNY